MHESSIRLSIFVLLVYSFRLLEDERLDNLDHLTKLNFHIKKFFFLNILFLFLLFFLIITSQ